MPPNPKDRPARPTPEQVRALQDEADAQAREVLSHVYKAILKTPGFTLRSGVKCRVDPMYAPEVNDDGDLKCAFDVLTADGSHLEFTVGHTGWGKSFVRTEAQKPKPKLPGRQR
jgi:hypothetical protein